MDLIFEFGGLVRRYLKFLILKKIHQSFLTDSEQTGNLASKI